ncbi:hypothetical protein NXW11_24820 [Bacteroides thetaiotaomicron]|nr:hypothetical protein [Bacteroides thetaiotaomicron]
MQAYGTFQQQKLAIATEYAEKIFKTLTSGSEKLSLGVERDSKLAGIEVQELKARIDRATVFGEFGGMFSDMIKPVLADARKYMLTDDSEMPTMPARTRLSLPSADGEGFPGGSGKVTSRKTKLRLLPTRKPFRPEGGTGGVCTYTALIAAQKSYIEAQQSGTEQEEGVRPASPGKRRRLMPMPRVRYVNAFAGNG